MKLTIILSVFLCYFLTVFASDIIVRKDGEIIEAKVLEINTNDIKYKKQSNLGGPTYTIGKSDLHSIKYENGEIDKFLDFNSNSQNKERSGSDKIFMGILREVPADSDNVETINKYNNRLEFVNPPSNKKSDKYVTKWGVTENSILSNEEVRIFFSFNYVHPFGILLDAPYSIYIVNKTDKTLIFDLERCFRISKNGKGKSYFDNSISTSISSSSTIGGSVSGTLPLTNLLPGITIGASKESGVSTSYNNNNFIIVAPRETKQLIYNELVKIGNSKYRFLKVGEGFNELCLGDRENKKNKIYNFSELDSPAINDFIFAYTTKDKPFEYTEIKFTIYVQQILCGLNLGGSFVCGVKIGEDISKYRLDTNSTDMIKLNKIFNKNCLGWEEGIYILGENW